MNAELPTLNSVSLIIEDCLHATAPTVEGGYPLIRTPNIERGRLNLKEVYRVTQETYEKWTRRAIPQDDDLILAREAPAGNVAIVKNGEKVCLGQRTVLIRPNSAKVYPDFLCYFLLAPKQQGFLLGGATGATAAHVNMKDIRRLPLPGLPKLTVQKFLGDLLTRYDDLIQNNLRRIKLLEESARLLYQEWFVHVRFPGYEHTPKTNGLPKGWRKATAFDATQVMSGGTPKTTIPDFWDGEIPFYTPKDSVDSCYVLDTEKHVTELGLQKCNSKLYPKDTIFITARGTVGNLNLAQRAMAMNQSCYALAGKDGIPQKFLFCVLKEAIQHFHQRASGAVFDAIIVDTFKMIPFIIPDLKLVKLFEETVEPMFQQVENLLQQNQKLRAARDLLLPKLMNGEIAV